MKKDNETTPLRQAELEISARLRKRIKPPEENKYGAILPHSRKKNYKNYKYLFKSKLPEPGKLALAGLAINMFPTRHELSDTKKMREG